MSPKPASTRPPDARKTKKELLNELQELRVQIAVLKGVEASNNRNAEALRGSRVDLQALLDATQESIFLMEPDGTTIAINYCTARRLGSTPGEMMGKNMYDCIPHDVAVRRRAYAEEVLRTGKPARWEDVRNGRIIDNNVYPVFSEDGRVVRLAIFGRDVTEERSATKALAASEEKYRRIVETANEGIWIIDRNDVTTFINPRMAEMLGYPPEEVLGKTPFYFMDENYQKETHESLNNRRNGIREQVVCKYLRKDGSDLWAIVSANPLYDGNGGYTGALAMLMDITERKHVEAALREKERQLAEGQVLTDTGSWEMDLASGAVTFSDNLLRIVGLSPGRHTYEEFRSRVHPEDRGRRDTAVADSIHGKPYNIEYRIIRPDGNVRHIHAVGRLTHDPRGKPVKFIATIQDITERKRAEETLLENRRVLVEAQQIAHLASWRWNVETGGSSRSDEFYRILGIEPVSGEPSVFTFIDHIHPDDREMVRKAMGETFTEGKPHRFEARILRPDGSVRVVLEQTGKITRDADGKPLRVVGTMQDITERKQTEELLAQQANLLSMVYDGVWAVDAEFRFTYWNKGAERILGWTAEETLGKVANDLLKTRIGGASREESIKKLLQDGHYDGEASYLHKDGRYVPVEVNFSVVKGPNGEMKGLIVTGRDITERKRAEEELKAAKQQAELYLDLMGHDINNLHQVALGYLELARDQPAASGGQMAFIDKAAEVLQRSAQLIGNVRKLQKLREGALLAVDVDVRKILADIQSEYATVPGKTLTLNTNGLGHCTVRANDLLHDVFANLVNNAIKHTGERAEVTVGLDMVGDNGRRYCRVSVEDNGPGIPNDNKERIFNRMHMSSSKGMGIGLYLVKTLVDSYSGRVWAEDRVPGDHTKGARFVVMLPAVD